MKLTQVYHTEAWLMSLSPGVLEQLTQPHFDGMVLSNLDMSDHGWVRLGKARIEVELDMDDLPQQAVKALRLKKEELMARAQLELTRIEDEIQKLQSRPLLADPLK
jgi:hypothetical protein